MSDQFSLFGDDAPPPPPPPAPKGRKKAPAPPPEPAQEAPRAVSPPWALPPQQESLEDLDRGPRCIVAGCIHPEGRCGLHRVIPRQPLESRPELVIPPEGWVQTLGLWHYLRTYRGGCGFEAQAFPGAVIGTDPAGPGRLTPEVCGRCWAASGACIRCKVPAGCAQHSPLERACSAAELAPRY